MDSYVFDTSALICYIENEKGAEEVELLLVDALEKNNSIHVSIVSLIEVFYISLKEQGEKIANERLELLKALPLDISNIEMLNVKAIGNLKAHNKISFADSCIAALTLETGGVLVHKDPEFEPIKSIKQMRLPYKK